MDTTVSGASDIENDTDHPTPGQQDAATAGAAAGDPPVAEKVHEPVEPAAVVEAIRAFVGRCVEKQLVYPTLLPSDEDAGYVAAWRLLLADRREVETLAALADHLPEVEGQAALTTLENLLSDEADRAVREVFAGDRFAANVHKKAGKEAAVTEAKWLSALLKEPGEDTTVRSGLPRELEQLADRLGRWSAALGGRGAAGDYKLRLTLIEPPPELTDEEAERREAEGEYLWRLELHLLPVDSDGDVSGEAMGAHEVWHAPGGTLGVLGRDIRHRRERLRGELRRSAGLVEAYPPLQRAAADERPVSIPLSTGEAFNFLRDVASILSAHNIDVRLPAWAEESRRGVEMTMSLTPTSGLGDDDEDVDPLDPAALTGDGEAAAPPSVGLDTLLRFDWKMSVGGIEVSQQQFDQLVGKQRPLVKIDGRWVEIDPNQAGRAAEVLAMTPEGDVTLGQAFTTAFRLTGQKPGENGSIGPSVQLSGSDWIARLLEQSPTATRDEIPQPEGLGGTLRPYQLRGFQWLAFLRKLGLGGCLADDMGLGKTIQTISLLLHEKEQKIAKAPTLLFAPTSVVGNWQRELVKFAPALNVHVHQGPERLHGADFTEAAKKSDVVLTSYALAHRDVDDLRSVSWHRIALDEAQKVKNPAAAGSKAIRSFKAPHRVALTGTPIENHLTELWSLMDLLNPGLLGGRKEFRDRFATAIEKQKDQQAAERLRRMIRPFVLRRTKTDPEIASSLPAKMEMKTYCPLTAEQAAIYQRLTTDMLGQIDQATGIRRRGLILAVLTRLKQVCDHPALLEPADSRTADDVRPGRSGKCERLLEMLEEVRDEGESALVFSQYREMGDMLKPMLEKHLGVKVHFLHGGVPQPKREEMVLEFQDKAGGKPDKDGKPTETPEPQIFILSLRAGGLGLNLTAARHVFHFDRWWNPAVENQATDRAHRIGQTKTVQVHKFVTLGTVEERIDKLLEDKRALADNIVGSGDDWLTDLSTQELRDYLKLDTSNVVGDNAADVPANLDGLDLSADVPAEDTDEFAEQPDPTSMTADLAATAAGTAEELQEASRE